MKKSVSIDNLIEIGQRLFIIRKKLNLTQPNFAAMLGLSNSTTLLRYEKGEIEPPLAIIRGAAHFGETSTDWILTGKGPEPAAGPPILMEDKEVYEIAKMVKSLPKSKYGLAREIIRAMVADEQKKKKGKKEGDENNEAAS